MTPAPSPLELLEQTVRLHAEMHIQHKESQAVHQHWLTAYADQMERHHLRMDALQVTLARLEVTLAAIKDLLERRNGGTHDA
jgi:hypothetical protein